MEGLISITKGKAADAASRWRALRWPALVVGLILVGGALTYLVVPPTAGPQRVVEYKPPPVNPESVQVARMPSVAGLSLDTARLVFRDAGVPDVRIVSTRVPAPGAPGLVITQSPEPGARINGAVHLGLSSALKMPATVGRPFASVQAALEHLGAIVQIQPIVVPDKKAGTVLSSVPGRGVTMPAVVTLRVADPGKSVALADLSESSSDNCYSTYSAAFGNKTIGSSVACDIQMSATSSIVYKIGGHAYTLSFTSGYDTNAGRGTGTFHILGDGRVLATIVLSAVPTQHIVSVKGVQTLRIEATGQPASSSNPPTIVLGNAVLQGLPAQISKLSSSGF